MCERVKIAFACYMSTAHVCCAHCSDVSLLQWQCQSGRALGPSGPGRHCSTVMSPLPVQGGRGRGSVGGREKHRSAKLYDKGQKKSRLTIAGASPQSKPPQLTQRCATVIVC